MAPVRCCYMAFSYLSVTSWPHVEYTIKFQYELSNEFSLKKYKTMLYVLIYLTTVPESRSHHIRFQD